VARIGFALADGLNAVRLTWTALLALVITAMLAVHSPAAILGAAVAALLLLAASGRGSRSPLRLPSEPSHGPRHEERRLRGAFRRQSAPDSPGRPRQPRAPGQVLVAA
jgi:hypothetical protein